MKTKVWKSEVSKLNIKKINKLLDSLIYDKVLFVFPLEHLELRKKVIKILSGSSKFISEIINEDSYIVFRLAKPHLREQSWYHFDNYINTYVISIKIPSTDPKGNLYIWSNARKSPKNIFMHLLTKMLFQNLFSYRLINLFFCNKFKEVDQKEGDVLLFNGFTSLHYNEMTSSENRIIVIHNTKPFYKSKIVFCIEWFSRLLAKKMFT
jgi:hypothetical protein